MAKAAKIKYNKSGIRVQGDCVITGTVTYGAWAPTNVSASGTLAVAGATTLNGTVALGNAAADDITIPGSLAGDVTFKAGAARTITGPASAHALNVLAAGTGNLVLGVSGAASALSITTATGLVTVAGALTVTAGPLTVTAGGLTVTAGGLSVVAGDSAVQKLTAAGDLVKSSANGQLSAIKHAETEFTFVGGGATETIPNLIPAKAIVLGVTLRVTEIVVLGGGGASWSVGDGVTADLWGTGLALAAGTVVDAAEWKTTWVPGTWFAAANNIVLTANAGTFTSGKVRAVVHYIDLTAPTS